MSYTKLYKIHSVTLYELPTVPGAIQGAKSAVELPPARHTQFSEEKHIRQDGKGTKILNPKDHAVLQTTGVFVLLNRVYKPRAKADFLKITKRSFTVGYGERKKKEEATGRGGLFGGNRKAV